MRGRTYNDVVRFFKPDATDDEAGLLLWEMTAFPICGPRYLIAQLTTAIRWGRSGRTDSEIWDFESRWYPKKWRKAHRLDTKYRTPRKPKPTP